jgi:hypothetical protein
MPKVRALQALAQHLTERLPSGDGHDAWRALHGEVTRLASTAEALRNLHATRNPTETDAAHVKRVATAAAKFAKESEAALARANAHLQTGLATIAQRVKAKVRLVPDAYASEIRAAYRAMPEQEKLATLKELVDGNRGPEFAAIIKAPRTLTGLPEAQRKQYEDSFISTHAPEEMRAEEALMDAFEHALTSTRTAGEVARTYSNPAALAEITRAETAAAAAAKAFDITVSDS